MSEVKVNKVTPRSGTTLTIGDSGDTTNVVGTLQNNGAALVGDISSVVAGTNLSGGGTSGAVTLNLADASTSAKGAASFSSDNFAASSGAVTIKNLGVATAELQDDVVTTVKILNSNVTEAKVADNAITLAKMASGTDGNIISYDASGNPVAIATGSDGQVLTSAGAGAQPAFETPASAANTPSFLAYLSSAQSIPNTTATTLVYQAEVYDTASAYNTSNGVFTVPSGQGGKYFVTFATRFTNWNYSDASIYINDGSSGLLTMDNGDTDGDNNTLMNSGIVSLSAGATIKVDFYQNGGNNASMRAGQSNSWFGAFKLIGV
jgi:hypothetical protein